MKRPLLPSSPHRSLSVMAQNFEASLNDMSERLVQKNAESMLHHIERTYSVRQREVIISTIAEVRNALYEFVKIYDLVPSSVNEAQIVNAHCALLWTLLQDSRPDKLRRYGELPNELCEPLETAIDTLLKSVERLRKASSEKK